MDAGNEETRSSGTGNPEEQLDDNLSDASSDSLAAYVAQNLPATANLTIPFTQAVPVIQPTGLDDLDQFPSLPTAGSRAPSHSRRPGSSATAVFELTQSLSAAAASSPAPSMSSSSDDEFTSYLNAVLPQVSRKASQSGRIVPARSEPVPRESMTQVSLAKEVWTPAESLLNPAQPIASPNMVPSRNLGPTELSGPSTLHSAATVSDPVSDTRARSTTPSTSSSESDKHLLRYVAKNSVLPSKTLQTSSGHESSSGSSEEDTELMNYLHTFTSKLIAQTQNTSSKSSPDSSSHNIANSRATTSRNATILTKAETPEIATNDSDVKISSRSAEAPGIATNDSDVEILSRSPSPPNLDWRYLPLRFNPRDRQQLREVVDPVISRENPNIRGASVADPAFPLTKPPSYFSYYSRTSWRTPRPVPRPSAAPLDSPPITEPPGPVPGPHPPLSVEELLAQHREVLNLEGMSYTDACLQLVRIQEEQYLPRQAAFASQSELLDRLARLYIRLHKQEHIIRVNALP